MCFRNQYQFALAPSPDVYGVSSACFQRLSCHWPVTVAIPVMSECFIMTTNFFRTKWYLCLVIPWFSFLSNFERQIGLCVWNASLLFCWWTFFWDAFVCVCVYVFYLLIELKINYLMFFLVHWPGKIFLSLASLHAVSWTLGLKTSLECAFLSITSG